MSARAIAIAVVLAACGCAGRPVPAAVMVVSAPPGTREDVFHTMLVRAEAHGYRPERVSPTLGRFVVRSRRRAVAPHVLEVQCYADGRVAVRIHGLVEDPVRHTTQVPGDFRRELVALAQALGGR